MMWKSTSSNGWEYLGSSPMYAMYMSLFGVLFYNIFEHNEAWWLCIKAVIAWLCVWTLIYRHKIKLLFAKILFGQEGEGSDKP